MAVSQTIYKLTLKMRINISTAKKFWRLIIWRFEIFLLNLRLDKYL